MISPRYLLQHCKEHQSDETFVPLIPCVRHETQVRANMESMERSETLHVWNVSALRACVWAEERRSEIVGEGKVEALFIGW